MNALVSLVGAGPGDPGLLTRTALARLRRADLVLFDALVNPDVVALARRARRFPVGKRAGRPSMAQETIHALMIRAARRGQRVVRLKGGDPFVFGRGGEEALALRAAGIPFDVIPGVLLTLLLWLAGALIFAYYLATFANYTATYAGLASVMIVLIFLYMVGVIFIIGAEINAALIKFRVFRMFSHTLSIVGRERVERQSEPDKAANIRP